MAPAHWPANSTWFAANQPFGNAAELLLVPDHYMFRMLYSQGHKLEQLGIGGPAFDPRAAWRTFAENCFLFLGTPSRLWLNWVFAEAFGMEVRLDGSTADLYYNTITKRWPRRNSALAPCSTATRSS